MWASMSRWMEKYFSVGSSVKPAGSCENPTPVYPCLVFDGSAVTVASTARPSWSPDQTIGNRCQVWSLPLEYVPRTSVPKPADACGHGQGGHRGHGGVPPLPHSPGGHERSSFSATVGGGACRS